MNPSVQRGYYIDQYQPRETRTPTDAGPSGSPSETGLDDADYGEFDADVSDGELGYQDAFVDGGAAGSASPTDLQARLGDLLTLLAKSDSLVGEERKQLGDELNALRKKLGEAGQFQSPTTRSNWLASIESELGQAESTILGQAPQVDEFGIASELDAGDGEDGGDLPGQLKTFRDSLEKMENLSPEKRAEQTKKIDQWLSALELGATEPDAVSEQFEAMKAEVQEASLHSPAAQALAEATGGDAESIEAQAKSLGIDLSHPPTPPNQAMLELLSQVSEEYAGKVSHVEEAVKTRNEEIKKQTDAANAQNAANLASTSDNDNSDLTVFQNLYDLKYHQDAKSQDVMNAMQDANQTAQRLLQAVYPDAQIALPQTSSAEGWQAMNENYLNADKLTFNGSALDVFNASNGKLQVGSGDQEKEVGLVEIRYDWEGSGDWEDSVGAPSVNFYGEKETHRSRYDD